MYGEFLWSVKVDAIKIKWIAIKMCDFDCGMKNLWDYFTGKKTVTGSKRFVKKDYFYVI